MDRNLEHPLRDLLQLYPSDLPEEYRFGQVMELLAGPLSDEELQSPLLDVLSFEALENGLLENILANRRLFVETYVRPPAPASHTGSGAGADGLQDSLRGVQRRTDASAGAAEAGKTLQISSELFTLAMIPQTRRASLPEGNGGIGSGRKAAGKTGSAAPALLPVTALPQRFHRLFNNDITHFNKLQTECFDSLFNRSCNILLSAPTGAGKTNCALLAILHAIQQETELALAKRQLDAAGERGDEKRPGPAPKNSIDTHTAATDVSFSSLIVYLTPMKALASEITEKLADKLRLLGLSVLECTGDESPPQAVLQKAHCLILTPEKFDVITRKPVGDDSLISRQCLLIIDEIHLLGVDRRGPVLESLVARTFQHIEATQRPLRVIGISATIPNYEDVGAFLRVPREGMLIFDSTYRPVPLAQTVLGIKDSETISAERIATLTGGAGAPGNAGGQNPKAKSEKYTLSDALAAAELRLLREESQGSSLRPEEREALLQKIQMAGMFRSSEASPEFLRRMDAVVEENSSVWLPLLRAVSEAEASAVASSTKRLIRDEERASQRAKERERRWQSREAREARERHGGAGARGDRGGHASHGSRGRGPARSEPARQSRPGPPGSLGPSGPPKLGPVDSLDYGDSSDAESIPVEDRDIPRAENRFSDRRGRGAPGLKQELHVAAHLATEDAMDQLTCSLVTQEILQGRPVLVFIHSRQGTVRMAQLLADALRPIIGKGKAPVPSCPIQTLRALSDCESGSLATCVQAGVGFHNAGMKKEHRKTVERLFRDRNISVVCCTATLAWGVNLPCATVIVRGTEIYSDDGVEDIGILDLLQIFGRAGRPQFTGSGEVGHGIIITTSEKADGYVRLLGNELPIESSLESSLCDALNAEIVLGNCSDIGDCMTFLRRSFLRVRLETAPRRYGAIFNRLQLDGGYYEDVDVDASLRQKAETALGELREAQIISYNRDLGTIFPTEIGRIASYYYVNHRSMTEFMRFMARSVCGRVSHAELLGCVCECPDFKQYRMRKTEEEEIYSMSGERFSAMNMNLQTLVADAAVSHLRGGHGRSGGIGKGVMAKATSAYNALYSDERVCHLKITNLLDEDPGPGSSGAVDRSGNASYKANVLLQAFISRRRLRTGSLISDQRMCVTIAPRMLRAFSEACLVLRRAQEALMLLELADSIEYQVWFDTSLPLWAIIRDPVGKSTDMRRNGYSVNLEAAPKRGMSDILTEQLVAQYEGCACATAYSSLESFVSQDVDTIDAKLHNTRLARLVKDSFSLIPRFDITCKLSSISAKIILLNISLVPAFKWMRRVHGAVMDFWLVLYGLESDCVLHYEKFSILEETRQKGCDFAIMMRTGRWKTVKVGKEAVSYTEYIRQLCPEDLGAVKGDATTAGSGTGVGAGNAAGEENENGEEDSSPDTYVPQITRREMRSGVSAGLPPSDLLENAFAASAVVDRGLASKGETPTIRVVVFPDSWAGPRLVRSAVEIQTASALKCRELQDDGGVRFPRLEPTCVEKEDKQKGVGDARDAGDASAAPASRPGKRSGARSDKPACSGSAEVPATLAVYGAESYTPLPNVPCLSAAALHWPAAEAMMQEKFSYFNALQTAMFHKLYHTNESVLIGCPTGSGKTTCAELAILQAFRDHPGGKVLYIAPLKALIRERYSEWSQTFPRFLGRRVTEITGDSLPDASALYKTDVYITTPEKFDAVSRHWRLRSWVRSISLVVIDELHLIGTDRGYVLESIVSRLRYLATSDAGRYRTEGGKARRGARAASSLPSAAAVTSVASAPRLRREGALVFLEGEPGVDGGASGESACQPAGELPDVLNFMSSADPPALRIVGMSTAAANTMDVARWLGINSISNVFNFSPAARPVRLETHIQGFPGRHYCPRMATMNKPLYTAIKTHSPRLPVLVFASSRRQTRLTAQALIALAAQDPNPPACIRQFPDESLSAGIQDANCRVCLAFGIGIHNAGMSQVDRKIIEELYLAGRITLLIATSTVAWGLNLPAYMTVIKGCEYYDGVVAKYVDYDITEILQMAGRAGRPQYVMNKFRDMFVGVFGGELFSWLSERGMIRNSFTDPLGLGLTFSKKGDVVQSPASRAALLRLVQVIIEHSVELDKAALQAAVSGGRPGAASFAAGAASPGNPISGLDADAVAQLLLSLAGSFQRSPQAISLIMCKSSMKELYKQFFTEPFPFESSLTSSGFASPLTAALLSNGSGRKFANEQKEQSRCSHFPDILNAEISSFSERSRFDLREWMSRSFYYLRAQRKPAFYDIDVRAVVEAIESALTHKNYSAIAVYEAEFRLFNGVYTAADLERKIRDRNVARGCLQKPEKVESVEQRSKTSEEFHSLLSYASHDEIERFCVVLATYDRIDETLNLLSTLGLVALRGRRQKVVRVEFGDIGAGVENPVYAPTALGDIASRYYLSYRTASLMKEYLGGGVCGESGERGHGMRSELADPAVKLSAPVGTRSSSSQGAAGAQDNAGDCDVSPAIKAAVPGASENQSEPRAQVQQSPTGSSGKSPAGQVIRFSLSPQARGPEQARAARSYDFLTFLVQCQEFQGLPVRHNEDVEMEEIVQEHTFSPLRTHGQALPGEGYAGGTLRFPMPETLTSKDPSYKAFLLLQLQCSLSTPLGGFPLPATDFWLDLATALEHAVRISAAWAEYALEERSTLLSALLPIKYSQSLVQGLWYDLNSMLCVQLDEGDCAGPGERVNPVTVGERVAFLNAVQGERETESLAACVACYHKLGEASFSERVARSVARRTSRSTLPQRRIRQLTRGLCAEMRKRPNITVRYTVSRKAEPVAAKTAKAPEGEKRPPAPPRALHTLAVSLQHASVVGGTPSPAQFRSAVYSKAKPHTWFVVLTDGPGLESRILGYRKLTGTSSRTRVDLEVEACGQTPSLWVVSDTFLGLDQRLSVPELSTAEAEA